jgi:hypothetical protein
MGFDRDPIQLAPIHWNIHGNLSILIAFVNVKNTTGGTQRRDCEWTGEGGFRGLKRGPFLNAGIQWRY